MPAQPVAGALRSDARSIALVVERTRREAVGELEAIISRPGVMRGCFGHQLQPRMAREILWTEWRACEASAGAVHLSVRATQHGRSEIVGAGYLLDGDLRFFVSPDWHRCGVGRALVAALRAVAEQRHLPELSAWVFPENLASGRLLQACGFTPGAPVRMPAFERPVRHFRLPLDVAPQPLFDRPQYFVQLARA